jgi:hypothetical protein
MAFVTQLSVENTDAQHLRLLPPEDLFEHLTCFVGGLFVLGRPLLA